ncbi:MAG: hypothetical protein LUE27_01650 [Clostridia bacterium]|nr:hypothetical protein [Clostridia bacterium]
MEKEKTEHFHLLDKALQANLDSGALYDLIRDYKDTVDDLKEILTARAHLELLERIFDDGHYDEDGKWIPANIEWNIG